MIKIRRVGVYKNALSDFRIQENGGKESLAFRAGLKEFISLFQHSLYYLAQAQRKVSADIALEDPRVS